MKRDDRLVSFVMERSMPLREKEEQLATYASGLWKLFECPLRCYYDRVDPITGDSAQWFMVAAIGDWTHGGIQDMYKKAGIWRGEEVRGGSKEFNLSYRQDLLIADPLNGGAIVPVEIKSVNKKKYEKAERKPLPAHIMQLQCYLHFHKPEPYPYGYLHYCCRDQGEQLVWRVDHDPDFCEAAEQALLDLEMSIASNTPPSGNPGEWSCRFCEYAERCGQ